MPSSESIAKYFFSEFFILKLVIIPIPIAPSEIARWLCIW
jgi:hypothetical protein